MRWGSHRKGRTASRAGFSLQKLTKGIEMDVMTDLERLVALQDIEFLKARRDRAIDTKDWATYEALHAPDHCSHNEGFERWDTAAVMIATVSQIMADCVSVRHSHYRQKSPSNLPSRPSGDLGHGVTTSF